MSQWLKAKAEKIPSMKKKMHIFNTIKLITETTCIYIYISIFIIYIILMHIINVVIGTLRQQYNYMHCIMYYKKQQQNI